MIKRHTDFRVALVDTCDRYAQVNHKLTPLFIFKYVGSQKAYYVFGHRVKG